MHEIDYCRGILKARDDFDARVSAMTYAELLQILREAEQRVRDCAGTEIAVNSQETVNLVHERLRREGMTVADLQREAHI